MLQIIAASHVFMGFMAFMGIMIYIMEDGKQDNKKSEHDYAKLKTKLERVKQRIIDIENTLDTMFYEQSITVDEENTWAEKSGKAGKAEKAKKSVKPNNDTVSESDGEEEEYEEEDDDDEEEEDEEEKIEVRKKQEDDIEKIKVL